MTLGRKAPIRKVPHHKLFKSEPDPSWFGNPSNPSGDKRGWSAPNWLTSRFHFSFAEYSSSGNDSFGVLRVMNDDLVMPKRGFGEHGHANMEICTYVVEGALTHKDSMGTSETLTRGAIQFMTAGKGVRHSEHNLDGSKPLRFIQMWITPNAGGLAPTTARTRSRDDRMNKWCAAVSRVPGAGVDGGTAPVQINQDASVKVTELEPGVALPFATAAGRQACMLCVEGGCALNAGSETAAASERARRRRVFLGRRSRWSPARRARTCWWWRWPSAGARGARICERYLIGRREGDDVSSGVDLVTFCDDESPFTANATRYERG